MSEEYDVIVKWFSQKKGFGVVTLPDGIAALHANILRQAGFADISPGATLRVCITQGVNGRMVSEVLSVEGRTARAAPETDWVASGAWEPNPDWRPPPNWREILKSRGKTIPPHWDDEPF
jgi:cold shock CspA family protein